MKNYFKMGICENCDLKGLNGFIQFDKFNQYYYCMDCHKKWNEEDYDSRKKDYDDDYKIREADENLSRLNNM